MRIGDDLYFAPRIRFCDVDLDGPELPEQFRCRMAGFYLEPAEQCAQGDHAFAAGVLLVTCIDALARLRYGGRVGARFKRFAREDLQSFPDDDLAERFYCEFRNGLVHEGRLKKGACFSLDAGATVEELGGILLVNPKHLATEARSALDAYIALVTLDDVERRKLAGALKIDLEDDLRLAGA
jgi:hypothetical protein